MIYEEILFRIIEYDYPKDMPGFVEKILSKLNSSGDSFNIIQGCMIAIKSLVANYEFMLDEDRKPLNIIVPSLFSYLEKYAASILEKYNEQSAITMNVILKTFHASIHLDLPTYFVNEANLHRWMVFVKTILDSPIPPNLESPTQDDEECQIREKNVLWQNKKWCGRVLQRFIQKYGNPKFENKENKGLATLFEEKYSVSFLETFVAILFKRKSLFVSRKLLHFSLKYVFYALRLAKTWVTIHPHLEKIMFEVLMPMLYLTPKDESLWNNDPDEYVRKEDDFTQISNNNKNASMDLIEAICKKQDINNQPYLHLFFRYAAFCMINNQDPRTKQPLDLLLKEALLWALGILKDDIVNDEALKAQMETILEQYVLPEFKNQIGFLRARACWIFGKYGHIEFQNPQNIKIAVEGISHCLMDTQLPVRVKAAVALNCLLTQKEAEDLLRPSLPKILEIYLKLMDQIDNEGIVAALEGIVDSYQQEIVPYAFDLVVHLTSAFHKYCQKSNKQAANTNNDDEDDSEAEMAAAGCLEAIRRILLAKLPEITYTSLQQVLVPIFNYCFSEDGSDFIDEALSCLNILLYNSQTLSNIILFYYPILIYIIVGLPENINIQALTHLNEEQKDLLEKVKSGWGAEFLEAMLGCFKNYISKTKESFLTMNDLFGVSFINLLFKAINRVYEISLNGSDDLDMVLSTTLNITLIENNLGKIDNILPYILDTAIERIIKIEKSKQLKVVNFEVISLCLWYNPWITLTYLSSKNYVVPLFTNWFALLPQFKNDFDKIRVMFGLSSIFQMKENELPPEIISSCSGLIKQIVKLTSEILELREKEESFNSKDEVKMFNINFIIIFFAIIKKLLLFNYF